MRVKLTIIRAIFFSLISITGASAQMGGYIPSNARPDADLYVNPTPNGGYTMQRPGQMPTYANPTPNGGYTMQTPGRMPTYVNPTPNGGYTVQTPGQMPTHINPR